MDLRKKKATETCEKDSFQCNHCWRVFTKEAHMLNHQKLHRVWHCKNCPKKFGTEKGLKNHEKSHCEEHPLQCKTCGQKFKHEKTLAYHEKVRHASAVLECSKCDITFTRLWRLKAHESKIHGINSLKCMECNEEFSSRLCLIMHKQTHFKVKNIPCSKCNETFTSKYYLYLHQQTHKGSKPFPCHICGEQFSYKLDRSDHINIQHSGEKTFHCEKCGQTFTSKKEWKNHKGTACVTFACELCDMKFALKTRLTWHINNNHMNGKPHECEICQERFEKKLQLIEHERIHGKDKPFQCKVCSNRYSSRSSLKCHQQVHTGVPLPSCKYCNRTFLLKSQLAKHEITHIEGKPFKCDVCPKRYTTKCHLREHMRVHLRDISFQCEYCGKLFPYKQSLRVHVRSHTGEKPYHCSVCNLDFSDSRHYKNHQKMNLCSEEDGKFIKTNSQPDNDIVYPGTTNTECDAVLGINNEGIQLPSDDLPYMHSKTVMQSAVCEEGVLTKDNVSHSSTTDNLSGLNLPVSFVSVQDENVNSEEFIFSTDPKQLSDEITLGSTLVNYTTSPDDHLPVQLEVVVYDDIVSSSQQLEVELDKGIQPEALNVENQDNVTGILSGVTSETHCTQSQVDSMLSLAKLLQNFSAEISQIDNEDKQKNSGQPKMNEDSEQTTEADNVSKIQNPEELQKFATDEILTGLECINEEQQQHISQDTTSGIEVEQDIAVVQKDDEKSKISLVACVTGQETSNLFFEEDNSKNGIDDQLKTPEACTSQLQSPTGKLVEKHSESQSLQEGSNYCDNQASIATVNKSGDAKTIGFNDTLEIVDKIDKHTGCIVPEQALAEVKAKSNKKSTGKTNFVCRKCKNVFSNRYRLDQHRVQCGAKKVDKHTDCIAPEQALTEVKAKSNKKSTGKTNFVCRKCKNVFSNRYRLDQHRVQCGAKKFDKHTDCIAPEQALTEVKAKSNKKSTGKTNFVCRKCKNVFSNRYRLDQHRVQCGAKKFECKECKEVFPSSYLLSKHGKLHLKEKPFNCDECSEGYITSKELKIHKYIHTGEFPFNCRFCVQYFPAKSDFLEHMRKHHRGENPYKCAHCLKTFEHLFPLKEHLLVHSKSKPFECASCNKKFKSNTRLKIHTRIHTGENLFTCNVCNKKFVRRTQLSIHEKTHLRSKLKASKPPEVFDCTECSKVFQNKRQMKRHKKFHKYGRPFLCKYCGRKFVERCTLVHHEKIHIEGKAHQCQMCEKKFDTIGHLKEHFLVHSGEKPFQCETCGKLFGFRRTLQRHLRVHTGEKPYQCNICDRRFPDAGKVRNHQKRIHVQQIANARVLEVVDSYDKVETEVVLDETCDAAVFLSETF